jgi:hypothetical protein
MTIQTPVFVSTSPDDGQGDKLRDAFIKINERFQDIASLMQNRGNWTTGTQYQPRDYILQGGEAYVCVIGHTAGTFATDLAAGKWASVDALDLRADLASTTVGKGAALVAFEGGGNVQDLKEAQGSSLVGFKQAGAGAVERTGQDKMRESVSVKDFGAVGDGVADDTVALLNFFTHCINTGTPGHISAGSYLVTAGVLAFDNGFTNKAWPHITTDGYQVVTFLRADATNAPMITLSNGTITSTTSRYWMGGFLGGLTFSQNGQATASNQHGLSLRGVWGANFGWLKADNLGGSCVHIPQSLFGGTNPDPAAVGFCKFDGIEANYCSRYAIENVNFVGFSGNHIKNLRAVENTLGGWFGFGSSNRVDLVSAGNVRGWMFDDGCSAGAAGGSASRISIGLAELDNVENGFRLNRTNNMTMEGVRFVHRFNTSPNTGGNYWPRKALEAGAGTTPNVAQIEGDFFHRIEAGGVLGDRGEVFDLSNAGANVVAFDFNNRIADNGALGVTDADLFTNVAASSYGVIRRDVRPVKDNRVLVGCKMAGAAAQVIPSVGYGTAAAKIPFGTLIYDRGSYWNTTNNWFVAPYARLYRIKVVFALNTTVGTLVRIGVLQDIGGALSRLAQTYQYQAVAGIQHYRLDEVVSVEEGGRIFIDASSATGATVVTSSGLSAVIDFTVTIEAL